MLSVAHQGTAPSSRDSCTHLAVPKSGRQSRVLPPSSQPIILFKIRAISLMPQAPTPRTKNTLIPGPKSMTPLPDMKDILRCHKCLIFLTTTITSSCVSLSPTPNRSRVRAPTRRGRNCRSNSGSHSGPATATRIKPKTSHPISIMVTLRVLDCSFVTTDS